MLWDSKFPVTTSAIGAGPPMHMSNTKSVNELAESDQQALYWLTAMECPDSLGLDTYLTGQEMYRDQHIVVTY